MSAKAPVAGTTGANGAATAAVATVAVVAEEALLLVAAAPDDGEQLSA